MADRDDAILVYRVVRDRGPVSAIDVAAACFPLPIASGPASTMAALRRRSVGRALRAVEWLRSDGRVAITCLSRPGFPSTFVLGVVAQGVEALSQGAVVVVTAEDDEVSDFMGLWHGE